MRACIAPLSIYCISFTVVGLFVCLLLFTGLKMTTSVSSRQFATDTKQYGLRIGHVNVYHLYNKLQDVCMLLTKSPYIHLLGLSETRLNSSVGDE